jgi:hypothetical protein
MCSAQGGAPLADASTAADESSCPDHSKVSANDHCSETWAALVLNARGITSRCGPKEQAKMYTRFMKRLRVKACKLRQRLEESMETVDELEVLDSAADANMAGKCSELYEV